MTIEERFRRFFDYRVSPSDYGIDETSRFVVFDKKTQEFCMKKEIPAGEVCTGSTLDLGDHHADMTAKLQIRREGRWIDRVPYFRLRQERVFNERIKYLFFPSSGAKDLIVVFQAISTTQAYNYIGTLSDVPAHRLYIKDDYGTDAATKSSYYLGENRSFDIAKKVQGLLEEITRLTNVPPERVVTAGSSKGGYAALYHGFAFEAGHIVAGGPQVMLGSYLRSEAAHSILPPILRYLAGDDSEGSADWADSILPDLLAKRPTARSRVYLHVGKGEPHYRNHAVPFLSLAKAARIDLSLDLAEYDTHEELAKHFPSFLRSTALSILSERSSMCDAELAAGDRISHPLPRKGSDNPEHSTTGPGSTMYPYELLTSLDANSVTKHADEILKTGWRRRNYPPVEMSKPVPWTYSQAGDRSWNFYIHSLDMLDPLLAAYDRTMERRYLIPALQVALDWVARHRRSASGVSDMAWYDMAVGLRAYRLAYLYQAAAMAGILEPTWRQALWNSLEEHRAELADELTIKFHNNHGYYQVAGQMALGRRFTDVSPAMKALYDQGRERFSRMLDVQFTDDGVHREHSPDYHRMVLDTLKGLIRSGIIEDETLRARALLIEEALAWFIYPSGDLVNFGDSDSRSMRRSASAAVRKWDTSLLQAVSSAGAVGGARPAGLKLFQRSGYAIVRCPDPADPQNVAGDSYLAQTAAFHSRTHKHADDLSFVWYDRGQLILVDAGRYGYIGKVDSGSELWLDGYWYSDPMRVFMESTRAHNTLEFDGRNHQRRSVRPYGSAMREGADVDGTFAIETRCKQFGSIQHDRVLAFRPREWLVVFDVFADNRKASHDVKQWFHLAPGHCAAEADGGFDVVLAESGAALKVASLLPGAEPVSVAAGQKSPVLQGWWSGKEREALPAPAFAFRHCGGASGVFATLFSFTSTLCSDFGGSRSNVTGRRSRLRWHDDRGDHQLSIDRELGLSIAYAVK